jgi:hypothetical protein
MDIPTAHLVQDFIENLAFYLRTSRGTKNG